MNDFEEYLALPTRVVASSRLSLPITVNKICWLEHLWILAQVSSACVRTFRLLDKCRTKRMLTKAGSLFRVRTRLI